MSRATRIMSAVVSALCAATVAKTAVAIAAPAQAPLQPITARILGVAFDSTVMRPLPGAIIQLVAADNPSRIRSTTADDRGAYAIDSVRAGTYLLGFMHPRLDALGLDAPLTRIDVRVGGDIRVPVAVPSGPTLVTRLCGVQAARDSVGLFMGVVRSARGTPLAAPARVRAQWVEVTLGPTGVERHSPSHYVTTSATGNFALCGVPTDGTFLVRAFAGTDSSGFVELEGSRNRLIYRDLFIGGATKSAATGPATLRGTGAVRGVVRTATGRPLRDARLVLWGSGREDTTSATGQFIMPSLPTGTYSMEVRALGFLPKRVPVDLRDSAEVTADFAMDAFVPSLDTMRVRADRPNPLNPLVDFERRKRMGGGYFVDETQLARRNPIFMSDIFRMVPGTTVMPADMIGDRIFMRGLAGSGSCTPTVFLNGVRTVSTDGSLDNLVNPQAVKAVEVYSRTGSTPPQFDAQNGCGSIVIWTGMRKTP